MWKLRSCCQDVVPSSASTHISELSFVQKEVEQLGALLGNHPSLCHVSGDGLVATVQPERKESENSLKRKALDSVVLWSKSKIHRTV